jgi:hypothetical protein
MQAAFLNPDWSDFAGSQDCKALIPHASHGAFSRERKKGAAAIISANRAISSA